MAGFPYYRITEKIKKTNRKISTIKTVLGNLWQFRYNQLIFEQQLPSPTFLRNFPIVNFFRTCQLIQLFHYFLLPPSRIWSNLDLRLVMDRWQSNQLKVFFHFSVIRKVKLERLDSDRSQFQ